MNDVVEQGTAEWLELRKGGIGGSEVSALYPCEGTKTGTHHPWLSPYKLWALKTGRLKSTKSDPIETPALWWGTHLEPVVRVAYAEVTSREVVDGDTHLRNPRVQAMIANTDGTILGDPRGPGVYEGKTTTIFSRSAWDDGVPLYYQAQVQHYMACTGYTWGSVALYMAGERQPLRYYDIERNDAFIADIEQRVAAWWERHIVNGEEPEPDASEQTRETIAALWPDAQPASVVDMGDDWADLAEQLDQASIAIKVAETKKRELENKIKAAIADREFATLPDGSGFSLKTSTRKGYTKVVQPSTYRTLRRVRDIDAALAKLKEKTQ